ncbi:UNVERIFIED_CONTAM: hypothetical protein K2H54_022533 [Gekko kuhli]
MIMMSKGNGDTASSGDLERMRIAEESKLTQFHMELWGEMEKLQRETHMMMLDLPVTIHKVIQREFWVQSGVGGATTAAGATAGAGGVQALAEAPHE